MAIGITWESSLDLQGMCARMSHVNSRLVRIRLIVIGSWILDRWRHHFQFLPSSQLVISPKGIAFVLERSTSL